jgi:hypothetical protein
MKLIYFQIDLLAAARCNLFSHSLATYQTNWMTISVKNLEVLRAHIKVIEKEPRKHKFGILKELAAEEQNHDEENQVKESTKIDVKDEDQRLFFGDEFSDAGPSKLDKTNVEEEEKQEKEKIIDEKSNEKLIDYEKEFDDEIMKMMPSQLLMNDSIFSSNDVNNENFDLLSSLVPQKAIPSTSSDSVLNLNSNPSKKNNDVSKWFNLFSDLDPLSQQRLEQDDANKNLHAA